MKKLAKVMGVLLSVITAFGVFASVGCNGCGKGKSNYDPETRPLTMSIGELDGNFNPFFYTAQNDGSVISMTQVSMLASDASGNPVCGEDRPTVAKDFTVVENKSNGETVSTTYEFLIKNGMKFSDGEDLNIMDVLFNFYVYLDEAYLGSNTLYSTDIKGLKAYHAQDPDAADDDDNDTSETFRTQAYTRIFNVINYCNGEILSTTQIEEDIVTIIKLFKDEVKSDWTSVKNDFDARDVDNYEYRFTEAWEAYLFNEGIVTLQYETNDTGTTVPKKDGNGKYLTDLDKEENDEIYKDELNAYVNNANNIKKYTDEGATEAQAKENLKRDWAIDFAFMAMTGFSSVNDTITVDSLEGKNYKNGVAQITQYWATGDTVLEQFTSEARTEYYEDMLDGNELAVKTISGITAYRTTKFNGTNLSEAHDVLKVEINGVDPKAIWNFSITVSPMHYYSTEALTAEADADYQAYLNAYNSNSNYELTKFGVKFADAKFFGENGLQAGNKNRLPVGAGSYKASTKSGGNGTANGFHSNKFVYYERNTYFETMGSELENAIIKSIRYAEIGDDKVITALLNEEIDYGMPSGNAKNSASIAGASSYLGTAKYQSNGYGYVGINPKFVPNVYLRRAIMKAMNTTSTISNYYTQEWASVIYRPMSKNSWAYPEDATEYTNIKFTSQQQEIKDLIAYAGYSSGDPELKLTFTIAGSTTDHPAFQMFTDAAKTLNACGMDITVATDIQALKKLASGNLAVWAAAWSSSIDPDMYQVYHKDSRATSVKNWNYPEILADNTDKFSYERGIINQLSDKIDEARETTDQIERKNYYAEALDLVMDLAVELPTYQRNDYEVYNKKVINSKSLSKNASAFSPLFDRIWEVSYN